VLAIPCFLTLGWQRKRGEHSGCLPFHVFEGVMLLLRLALGWIKSHKLP
jgi:hypothetical protein